MAVEGIFKLCDTVGFPLEFAMLELADRGLVVNWADFITDAIDHGWSKKTIRSKILGASEEAFGRGYKNEMAWRLDRFLS